MGSLLHNSIHSYDSFARALIAQIDHRARKQIESARATKDGRHRVVELDLKMRVVYNLRAEGDGGHKLPPGICCICHIEEGVEICVGDEECCSIGD